MNTRIHTTHPDWSLRARSWLVALTGPCLWLPLFGITGALAARSCDLLAGLRLGAVVALGVSVCGLVAVLGLRRLQRYAEREPDARYLLPVSVALHAMCALSLVAQLIPIVLCVR